MDSSTTHPKTVKARLLTILMTGPVMGFRIIFWFFNNVDLEQMNF